MFTLTKAPADGPFGKRVNKVRNHQNHVQTANCVSRDENQERRPPEIAHLEFDHYYRPEAPATSPAAIELDKGLLAPASPQLGPRYGGRLRSEPARLAKPDSAEYRAAFVATLLGTTLVNAVLCYRAIGTLIVDAEMRARSQRLLIYRYGIHAITAAIMKRSRNRIGVAALADAIAIAALLSQPDTVDQLPQQTFSLGQHSLPLERLLDYFRNRGNVATFWTVLAETHIALAADTPVAPLRNIHTAANAYSRKRVLDDVSSRAKQQ